MPFELSQIAQALAAVVIAGLGAWAGLLIVRRKRLGTHLFPRYRQDRILFFLRRNGLWQADRKAQLWLAEQGVADPQSLLDRRYPDAGGLKEEVSALVQEGSAFARLIPTGHGCEEIHGEVQGGVAILRLEIGLSQGASVLHQRRLAQDAEHRIEQLLETLRQSPFLIARREDGICRPFVLPDGIAEDVVLSAIVPGRAQIGFGNDAWYELQTLTGDDGSEVITGYPCNDLVAQERLFRGLLSTLSQSFARLPVGIILLGSDRRPVLFNPSAAELLGLDPAWLALGPDLRVVLEKLRDIQVLDFDRGGNCVELIARIEAAARDGGFVEDWPLPDGRLLQVSAWAEGHDALAFVIHDLSQMIELQRQRQADLMLSQSVLDSIPLSLAVFDASGQIILANEEFEHMAGISGHQIQPLRLNGFCQSMKPTTLTSSFWGDLMRMHQQGETGRSLQARTLPGGAIMLSFEHEQALAGNQNGKSGAAA